MKCQPDFPLPQNNLIRFNMLKPDTLPHALQAAHMTPKGQLSLGAHDAGLINRINFHPGPPALPTVTGTGHHRHHDESNGHGPVLAQAPPPWGRPEALTTVVAQAEPKSDTQKHSLVRAPQQAPFHLADPLAAQLPARQQSLIEMRQRAMNAAAGALMLRRGKTTAIMSLLDGVGAELPPPIPDRFVVPSFGVAAAASKQVAMHCPDAVRGTTAQQTPSVPDAVQPTQVAAQRPHNQLSDGQASMAAAPQSQSLMPAPKAASTTEAAPVSATQAAAPAPSLASNPAEQASRTREKVAAMLFRTFGIKMDQDSALMPPYPPAHTPVSANQDPAPVPASTPAATGTATVAEHTMSVNADSVSQKQPDAQPQQHRHQQRNNLTKATTSLATPPSAHLLQPSCSDQQCAAPQPQAFSGSGGSSTSLRVTSKTDNAAFLSVDFLAKPSPPVLPPSGGSESLARYQLQHQSNLLQHQSAGSKACRELDVPCVKGGCTLQSALQ